VEVEGKAEGTTPTDYIVKLKNNSNTNLANLAFSGNLWPLDVDDSWTYGASWFNWNNYWNAAIINASDFGVEIQLRNTSDEDFTAYVDQIKIEIAFTPPYTLCSDHACIIASVLEDPLVSDYTWIVPNDYNVISESSTENLIIISPVDVGLGNHEICVTPNGAGYTQCCTSFTLEDCTPGTIGDYVFDDRNDNGVQDIGDLPIEGLTISLLDDKSNVIGNTISDGMGFYQFANITSGVYYIEISNYDKYILSKADVGNDNLDSDLSEILGPGTTDLFILNPGQNKTDIDLGLRLLSTIAGVTWLDDNGNGLNDNTELSMSDIGVSLFDQNNQLIANTITDVEGKYIFENLLPDFYYVVFDAPGDFVFTTFGLDSDVDNSFASGSTGLIDVITVNDVVGIDAGMYEYAGLGDFIWYDLNRNGLQDTGEPGIPNLSVTLVSSTGSSQQINTDNLGKYEFVDIAPGSYSVEIEKDNDLQLSLFNQGNGTNDSDILSDIGTAYSTQTFALVSAEVRADLDFGFQYKPSSIAGKTWEDFNGNGLNDAGEMQLASIPVALYNENNVLVKETLTDASGSYIFELLNPGNYYVVFQKTGSYVFTMFGMDSDVNGNIVDGSTNLITLNADTDIEDIDAGFYEFASLGDYIWLDLDRDGIQDADESGIAGLDIKLLQSTGIIVNKVTDANGIYTYDLLPPGDYIVSIHNDADLIPSAFNQGNGSNDSDNLNDVGLYYNSALITLTSGLMRTDLDFGFQYKPSSISGSTWEDNNGNGLNDAGEIPLSSVPVKLYNENNELVAETVTTVAGTYTFDLLNPGNYYVVFEKTSSFVFTMFGMDSDVNESIVEGSTNLITLAVDTDINNIDAGFYKFASLGDFIWLDLDRDGIQDSNESGIAGLDVQLLQASGIIINVATDANGKYAYDLLVPGQYIVSIHNEADLVPTLFNQGNGQNDSDEMVDVGLYYNSNVVTLTSGEVRTDLDFGFQFEPASISGMVWEDDNADGQNDASEANLSGIAVTLFNSANVEIAQTTTAANGTYSFNNINPGDYYVVFKNPQGFVFTTFGMDSDVNGVIVDGATQIINVTAGASILSIGAGLYQLGSIGDYIWIDENRDGIQGSLEMGYPFVDVTLRDATGNEFMTQTDNLGNYSFTQLIPGDYTITFPPNSDFGPSPSNQGNGTNDSRPFTGSGTGFNSAPFSISSGENNLNLDFGFSFNASSISGAVWEDLNYNGNNDNGEDVISGVSVTLFESTLGNVAMTTTDANGNYTFDNLNPGMYYVVFSHVDPYLFTTTGGDSDVVGMLAQGATNFIALLADVQITGIDAGYYRKVTLGNYVWEDENKNGLQDVSESGIPGVTVRLLASNGTEVDMSITNANGLYQFVDVNPGIYQIRLEIDDTFISTNDNQGNGTNDSRFLNSNLTTNNINIISGQNNFDLDFGFVMLSSSIAGAAWYDLDADGNRENGEPLIPNVSVTLFTQGGTQVGVSTTDANGNYLFDNLGAGDYYVVFQELPNVEFTVATNDSDVTSSIVNGSTDVLSLAQDQNLIDIDAGYVGYSSVGDYVWFDENGDGIQNGSESGLEDVEITLFDENGIQMMQTNSAADGSYSFTDLLPGDYYIIFNANSNYVPSPEGAGNGGNDSDITDIFGIGSTSIFTLAFLQNRVDIDGGFEEVFATVAGNVFKDVDANGLNQSMDTPLSGILVELFDTNNALIKTTNTNAQGDYVFSQVLPNDYYVKFGIPAGAIVTLANQGANDAIDSDITGANGVNTTDVFTLASMGNVSDIDGGIYEYGVIGNQVWIDQNENGLNDNNESGLQGVTVSLLSVNGSVLETDMTDASGLYSFDDIIPGTYQIKMEMPSNYEFTMANVGNDDSIDSDASNNSGNLGFTNQFLISCGEVNLDIDAGVILTGEGSLSGSVWEDDNADGLNSMMETSLQGITVELFTEAGVLIETTSTDANGNYAFIDIAPQQVYVVFTPGAGQVFTDPNVGMDDTIDSDVTNANGAGSTALIMINIGGVINNVDAGLYSNGTIGNFVWIDENENGIQDVGEDGINGVIVQLFDTNSMLIATTNTSSANGLDGVYSFDNVKPGSYVVGMSVMGDYVFTIAGAGNGANDSDIIQNGTGTSSTLVFMLGSGQTKNDVDGGVFEIEGNNIQGFVFEDVNGDGLKDLGDNNINGVVVNLYTQNGTLVTTTTTVNDGNGIPGYYTFVNIGPGDYYVEFIFPNGGISTLPNVGNNDALDSDVTDANGIGTTDVFTVPGGAATNLICGGYYIGGIIGDYVWNDMIDNGIQDASEEGVNNIIVRLFNSVNNQVMITSTFTNGSGIKGFYEFAGVKPGDYYIRVDSGSGMTFTDADQGSNDNLDSDIDGSNGPSSTSTFTVISGSVIDNMDAGLLMQPASVGNYVWEDQNGDGIQDPSEDGIQGVIADLYNESMAFVATTTTDANGAYMFTGVQPGLYYIVFTPPGDYKSTDADQGGNDTKDSDIMNVIQQGATNIFDLSSGENDRDIDGGFFLPADIGDYVWNDLDKDGIQDANEPGIPGVSVDLRLGTFFVLETVVTDANGFFKFECVKQGVYSLRFYNIPSGFQFSPMDAGSDDTIDSDANANGETALISLAHGVDFMDLDAGIHDTNMIIDKSEFTISTWPMPATDLVNHEIKSNLDSPISWTIVNAIGQPIKAGSQEALTHGSNQFTIDVSDLIPGTYYIKYQMYGFSRIKPLIVKN